MSFGWYSVFDGGPDHNIWVKKSKFHYRNIFSVQKLNFVGCIKYVNIMSFEVIFVTPCYIRLFKICKICLPFQNWWKQAVKYKYQDIQDFSSKPKICAMVKISIFDEFFTKIIILVKVIFFWCILRFKILFPILLL